MRKLKSKRFKKSFSINFIHEDNNANFRKAEVKIGDKALHGRLIDLPCITESAKTCDKIRLFKVAEVSQMLVCQEEEFSSDEENVDAKEKRDGDFDKRSKKNLWPHGLTPPMKNVRKQRFRKSLKCVEDVDNVEQVAKEVMLLLKADNNAVSLEMILSYVTTLMHVFRKHLNYCSVIRWHHGCQLPKSGDPFSTELTSSAVLYVSIMIGGTTNVLLVLVRTMLHLDSMV